MHKRERHKRTALEKANQDADVAKNGKAIEQKSIEYRLRIGSANRKEEVSKVFNRKKPLSSFDPSACG